MDAAVLCEVGMLEAHLHTLCFSKRCQTFHWNGSMVPNGLVIEIHIVYLLYMYIFIIYCFYIY